MRAAVLKSFGSPLVIEDRPDLELTSASGEVIVDIVTAPVLNYMRDVLSGARNYLMEPPIVPGAGAVGRVRAVGADATNLSVGDWVFCDPTVRSRDGALDPDITLQGLSARGDGGLRLQRYFHDGSWAEQMRLPTENVTPLGTIEESDAAAWCGIGSALVPYGGFLAARLQAGETVLVSGATGGFGTAAVAVALAMGAERVIATGRSREKLERVAQRFGSRVRTVVMTGDETADRNAMINTDGAPIDCVFDILPPMASAVQARAAIMAVRRYGRVVLMGGVNMQGGAGLELSYAWIMRNCVTIHGVWMYPREAPASLVKLVRSGLLPLGNSPSRRFALEEINEAVAHAADSGRAAIVWPGAAHATRSRQAHR